MTSPSQTQRTTDDNFMKSVAEIHKRLKQYLSETKPGPCVKTPMPMIIAIKGKWGTGKTFFWKHFIEKHRKDFPSKNYTYASFFSAKDILQLKRDLFSGLEQKTKSKNILKKLRSIITPLTNILSNISDISGVPVSAISGIAENFIIDRSLREIIICIDDLERRPITLDLSEIFGVLTSLRDEKGCQIILLFNEDSICEDNGSNEKKKTYLEYREKIFDVELSFSPDIQEICDLVFDDHQSLIYRLPPVPFINFDDDACSEQIFDILKNANVSNFRVITKIKKALIYFQSIIESEYPKLWPRFARNVVKIGCVHFLHGHELSLEKWFGLLEEKQRNRLLEEFSEEDAQKEDPNMEIANRISKKYNFCLSNEYSVIKAFFIDGFINIEGHKNILHHMETQMEEVDIWQGLEAVRNMLRGSFRYSSEEYIRSLLSFYEKNKNKLSPETLESILKEVGKYYPGDSEKNEQLEQIKKTWSEKITKIIDDIQAKGELDEHAKFASVRMNDSDTSKKIEEEIFKRRSRKSLSEVIDLITKSSTGWNPEDAVFLRDKTEDEFYQWIVGHQQDDIVGKIKILLSHLSSPDNKMAEIKNRIVKALNRIAERSVIDRWRVDTLILKKGSHKQE